MSRRTLAFILGLICCSISTTAYGQMSVDEAMARLRERQAERAAAATQPDAQLHSTVARPHIVDLSTRVQTLETSLHKWFGATIDPVWTPADTQEWLNTQASTASAAASQLVGVETTAKIIVESVTSDASGVIVQGHLFPMVRRPEFSRAAQTEIQPAQQQSDTAEQRLADLRNQLGQSRFQNQQAQMQLNFAQPTDTATISQARQLLSLTQSQIDVLQPQLTYAQAQSEQAQAILRQAQRLALQHDREHMQVWGPIDLNSSDLSLLKKLPGNIFTAKVRVTHVDVSVVRAADGAGWEYSSDGGNEGQTHMPMAPGHAALAARQQDDQMNISVSCDDISVDSSPAIPAASRTVVAAVPPANAKADAPPPTAAKSPLPGQPFVSTPRDETAMAASVGFVVVGFQAVLPSGEALQRPLVTGSCFAVTPTGYLLTNRHVIEEIDALNDPAIRDAVRARWDVELEPRIWVFFGKDQYNATVQYTSTKYDLAVLKIMRRGRDYFRLASKPAEARGADVFAAGFPGLGSSALGSQELHKEMAADDALSPEHDIRSQFKSRDFEFTLTKGAVGRLVSATDGERWVQHEAVIRHGNSGGPLLTNSGVVIAINTWAQRDEEGDIQTNMSQEISQFRQELDVHIPGLVWVSP